MTAALELLPATVGSERRAAAVWATAGATGAALGPAVGGLLTELVSWQSIFLFQVPVALAAAVPILAVARHEAATGMISTELRRTGRPHLLANLALALVSAAIAGALFLLVLLLIEGWRLSPIGAAIVVSVMPVAALPEPARPARCRAPGPVPRPARSSSPAGSAAWLCCPRPRSRSPCRRRSWSGSGWRWCSRR